MAVVVIRLLFDLYFIVCRTDLHGNFIIYLLIYSFIVSWLGTLLFYLFAFSVFVVTIIHNIQYI